MDFAINKKNVEFNFFLNGICQVLMHNISLDERPTSHKGKLESEKLENRMGRM